MPVVVGTKGASCQTKVGEPSATGIDDEDTMNRRLTRAGPLAAVVWLTAAPLFAQATVDATRFGHGTTVAIAGGIASDGAGVGAVAAGTIGWQVDARASVVSTFHWLHQGNGSDAFAGAFAVDVNLLPRRVATPFVEGGFGLYRAFYDVAGSTVPAFYRDRVDVGHAAGTTVSFVDPMMIVGAGVNIFATPHFALRPQVEAFVVTRGSQRHIATAFTVRAACNLEHHPFR
jgi:hypothetical protein